MNTARVVVWSCSCLYACAAQAAMEEVLVEPALVPASERVPLPTLAPTPPPLGLQIQLDSGIAEKVHRIVGFWPSVHWLNSQNINTSMAALGYTWRNLKLEGAIFKERGSELEQSRSNTDILSAFAASKRLGYELGPHWALQLSKGFVNSPDQFRPDQRIRRRTASLTYRGGYSSKLWHATLAVGQAKDLAGSGGAVYLLDTAMRLDPERTVFGRFERAGHDELFRNEAGPGDRSYVLNKLSVGYLYEPVRHSLAKLGFGGLISYRSTPSALLPYYGDKNTSYMIFMRLQMQFGGI